MNGKKAKKIRKKVYQDIASQTRNYGIYPNGQIVADKLRQGYQVAKGR